MDGNGTNEPHLEQHLNTANTSINPSSDGAAAASAADPTAATRVARTTRSKARSSGANLVPTATASEAEGSARPRRSARLSISGASNVDVEPTLPGGSVEEGQDSAPVASASGKRK
jgi:hypothetical protein